MPSVIKRLLARKDIDGVVLIGAVIKGDTLHDEVIMHATAQAAAQLAAQTGKPVGIRRDRSGNDARAGDRSHR